MLGCSTAVSVARHLPSGVLLLGLQYCLLPCNQPYVGQGGKPGGNLLKWL
jgi:hypothetical protein